MVHLGAIHDLSDMSSVTSSLLTSSDDEDIDLLADEQQEIVTLNGIEQKLPWHDNYWSIKITHVVSPSEVWAILTKDAGLLARAEQMVSILTLNLANRIVIDGIYIVKRKNFLHRVKAIETVVIDEELFIECFFIDIGRIETIEAMELYELPKFFAKIPPQAICFKLFRFDELVLCPRIGHYISAWLMHKQLHACLMMGEEQWKIQVQHGIQMPKVSVTPFTFYPKFALYKPILMKQIGESLPKPIFSHHSSVAAGTIINAKVSHVSPMGHVYFQLDEQSIKYIDVLIQQFVSESNQLTHRFHVSETANCVVLIYDIECHIYHRAKIIAVESGSTKYKCFCIDTGDTRSIDAFDVFGLNENSMLCYYPGQAVPAILDSVTDFDYTTFKRINAILTNDTRVQVKVVGHKGKLPIVTCYKQSMNINALVQMERELNNCEAHTSFPTDAAF